MFITIPFQHLYFIPNMIGFEARPELSTKPCGNETFHGTITEMKMTIPYHITHFVSCFTPQHNLNGLVSEVDFNTLDPAVIQIHHIRREWNLADIQALQLLREHIPNRMDIVLIGFNTEYIEIRVCSPGLVGRFIIILH